jgi:amino acid adenylation domain-containing protein/non-ribosomal peptide synthase protein (TIGR01720 family)
MEQITKKKKVSFQHRLNRSFKKHAHKTAIRYAKNIITYAQLEKKSAAICQRLHREDIQPGSFIGICLENKVDLIASIIAILNTRCVFVILDNTLPVKRLHTMIRSTHTRILITDEGNKERLQTGNKSEEKLQTVMIEDCLKGNPFCGAAGALTIPDREDKIYIYFTSGSSGTPKAIVGKNKSLLHFIDWEIETFGIDETFVISQLSAPGFDAFLRDVFTPLCAGATLCIPANEETPMDRQALIDWIDIQKIRLIHCVPSVFRLFNSRHLTAEHFRSLKYVLMSGERILPHELTNWYKVFGERIQLVNLYGPTETTMTKTCYFIQEPDTRKARIPVGKAIKGSRVFILNENLEACAKGIIGDIYIRSPFITHGYYNDPQQDNLKFIPNPFTGETNDLFYKTGDLGRILEDGNLDLVGRRDSQVKIKGMRVELEEIENALSGHDAVEAAAVTAREDREGINYLCAYVVPGAGDTLDNAALREFLAEYLPGAWIPAYFIPLQEMPLTTTGKIDRNALPKPRLKAGADYVKPGSPLEKQLVEIWSEMFGLEKEIIGITMSFFELGGDSLKGLYLVEKIHKELKARLSLADIFKNNTISKLSQYISALEENPFTAIEPVEKRDYYLLSSAQKRLYLLQQIDLNSTAYNMTQYIPLAEPPDIQRLEWGFNQLIQRHESLRTSFHMKEDQPVQRIHDEVSFKIEYYGRPEGEVGGVGIRPFDLSIAPLLRAGLVKTSPNAFLLVVDMHHIISDGVSHTILASDFITLYDGAALSPLKLQYKDFSLWQNSEKIKESIKHQETYWLNECAGEVPVLDLPVDFARPRVQSFEGEALDFRLNDEETRGLNALALEKNATLYMVLLAAYNILLVKLSGQPEIIVGAPVAGRRHADLQKIIGMFVNTLVLRNSPHGQQSFLEFLNHLKTKTLDAFENQDYPFEELVEKVTVTRDAGRNPLFDVLYILQNIDDIQAKEPGIEPGQDEPGFRPDERTSKFDITLMAVERPNFLEMKFLYCTKLFKKQTIQRFITYFKNIVSHIVNQPAVKLSGIEILSTEEKKQLLYDFNDTAITYPGDRTIHELFTQQSAKTPNAVALVGGGAEERKSAMHLSYRQLDNKTNRLAGPLKEKGVGPGTIVAIMADRSIETITGILGILKAGGAYLPIDPETPEERKQYMLKDSGAKMFHEPVSRRLDIPPKEANSINNYQLTINNSQLKSTSLAYVIYTSGSTGRPKGVIVEHRSLVNYICWALRHYANNGFNHLTLPLYTNVSFDLTVTSIYLPLLSGNKIVICKERENLPGIMDVITEDNVDIIKATPSHLKLLQTGKGRENTRLKRLIAGGEQLETRLARDLTHRFQGDIEIFNEYGPTEATVGCMIYKFNPAKDKKNQVPIGVPISNVNIYILDNDLKPVPINVAGEIYISGDALARGYLNDPGLTHESFVANPYLKDQRMYKSGDIGRFMPDGNIEFSGRKDEQVKVRGYRVELKEIENRLLKYEKIKEAVVLARQRKSDSADVYLCCYWTPAHKENPPDSTGIKEYLSGILPGYMIPAFFSQLAEIPLTPSGKVDRKALPEPGSEENFQVYEAPGNEIQERLVDVWSEVLSGVGRQRSIGIDDNFFNLGGDSIKAIQIAARLRKYQLDLKINDLFLYPVIKDLAGYVKKIQRKIPQEIVRGEVPLTPIQQWFFLADFSRPHHFNQAVMLYRKQGFNEDLLLPLFFKIVEHHDALRMVYKRHRPGTSFHMSSRSHPSYQEHDTAQINVPSQLCRDIKEKEKLFHLEVFSFKNEDQDTILKEIEKQTNKIQASINLENGPLLKSGLFKTPEGDHLLMVIHHLVIDGVSWRILFEDINTGYRQLGQGQTVKFQEKTDAFKYWSQALQEYAAAETPGLKKESAYWQAVEAVPILPLPGKQQMGSQWKKQKYMETVSMSLNPSETETLLKKVNHAYSTEINDILLTALAGAVGLWTGLDKVLIELEGHGRERILEDMDISRTVGWFTTRYPVVLPINQPGDLSYSIRGVKETLRRVPNKGIGYGILKYLTPPGKKKGLTFKSKPEITFNYLGQVDARTGQDTDSGLFQFSPVGAGNPISPEMEQTHTLSISGMVVKGIFTLSFSYNRYEYDKTRIRELVEHFKSYLLRLMDHCTRKQETQLTPADVSAVPYLDISLEEFSAITRHIQRNIPGNPAVESIYPLSPMQSGMLYHVLRVEHFDVYFIQSIFHLEGPLEIPLLETAFNEMIRRYDIFRTVFIYEGLKQPLQVVLSHRKVKLYYEEIVNLNKDQQAPYLEALLEKDKTRGIDLEKDVPMRLSLVKTGPDSYCLVWSYHHILMDGWCIGIVYNQLVKIYGWLKEQQEHKQDVKMPEPAVVTPYRNYIQWLEKQDKEKALRYWQQYLEGYQQPAGVPGTGPGIPGGEDAGKMEEYKLVLDREETNLLNRVAGKNRVTVSTIFQTLWGLLLQSYNNCDDVVFGAVVSGRPAHIEGIEKMVGLFINTIPVRIRTRGDQGFCHLLKILQENSQVSRSYEYVPLAEIQAKSRLKSNLIDHLLIFENYPVQQEVEMTTYGSQEYKDSIRVIEMKLLERTNYHFNVVIVPSNRLEIKFSYNISVYDRDFIKRIALHLKQILHQVLNNPGIKVKEMEILTEEERYQVLFDFNRTAARCPQNRTIHQLFAERVEKNPDSTAVVGRGWGMPDSRERYIQITYGQLQKKSGQLAGLLIEKGVMPDSIVAIMVGRSLEMIVGILGILQAGGAYLPIDPDYPEERINYMLADSEARILVTTPGLTEKFKKLSIVNCQLLMVNEKPPNRRRLDNTPKEANSINNYQLTINNLQLKGNNLAYVIYTSGSTGRPRGVLVGHGNVARLVKNVNFIDAAPGQRLLLTGAFVFDITTFEIWYPLLNGLSLFLPVLEDILDMEKLAKFVAKNDISILHLIPQLFYQALSTCPGLFAGLEYFLVGGDLVRPGPVNDLRGRYPHLKILHCYGPTENTTFSTVLPVVKDYNPRLPIGKPINNSQAYVLDRRGHLQPIGLMGELVVGGGGVARGYLNNPELTADRFCLRRPGGALFEKTAPPGPPRKNFLLKMTDKKRMQSCNHASMQSCSQHLHHYTITPLPHHPIYRTGDSARWLAGGNIEFLGRIDHQVKIRGFRIESGEIENQLLTHDNVKEAVVAAKDDENGDKYLCAYIVSNVEPAEPELKEYLSEKLPDYMIPAYFVSLESLPLNPNGKVDRNALPDPEIKPGAAYVPPGNEIQRKLVDIWSEILGRDASQASQLRTSIGIGANFFDLGGHSLKAMVMIARAYKEFQVKLPLAQVFKNPTIASLSGYIRDLKKEKYVSIEPVERKEYYVLSSTQKRLYVLQQIESAGIAYNMPRAMRLVGQLAEKKLERAFRQLIKRHESFRTCFARVNEEPVQRIHEDAAFEFEYYEQVTGPGDRRRWNTPLLRGDSLDEGEMGCVNDFVRPFDLSKAPLLRVGLIKESDQKHILMMDIHHIITDGTSMDLFVREAMALYGGKKLSPLKFQYKDYAHWQHSEPQKKTIKNQEEYWLRQFSGEIPILNLPFDYPRPSVQSFAGDNLDFELNAETSRGINRLARDTGATLYMVLQAVYYVLLSKLGGQEDIVMGTPTAGRRYVALERIIGMFVNTLASRNYPSGQKKWIDFLQEVREKTLESLENQDYPFENLVEKVALNRDTGRNPIFDTMFVLQNIDTRGNKIPVGDVPLLSIQPYEVDHLLRAAKFDLSLIASENGDKLFFSFEYCTTLFKQETIQRFITYFRQLLSAVLANPNQKISRMAIITEEEKRQILYDFNDTAAAYPTDKTIVQLFDHQVEQNPDAVALVGRNVGIGTRFIASDSNEWPIQITYRQLQKKSVLLAAGLIEKGVGEDTIVGIMADRSLEMITGIFGILTAGGAYLPIDPGYPEERINYMLADSSVKFLVTTPILSEKFEKLSIVNCQLLMVNEKPPGGRRINNYQLTINNLQLKRASSAYVIYTSGSTGKPKGVLIDHFSIVNTLLWRKNYYKFSVGDVNLQMPSFSFDSSVLDIFTPLLSGSCLVLPDEVNRLNLEYLGLLMERAAVTHFLLVPSLYRVFIKEMPGRLKGLKAITVAGEQVDRDLVREHFEKLAAVKLYNEYGPTENSVCSTVYQLKPGADRVFIGKPISNVKCYILDRDGNLTPPGITGELYVSGTGLARGYTNRPELTAEKFSHRFNKSFCGGSRGAVFSKSAPLAVGDKTYKTGDLARWYVDGNIEFLGRVDFQVKIRGYRIESAEIENQLLNRADVKEAVVTTYEAEPGNMQLCAYVAAGRGAEGAALDSGVLQEYLSDCVPGYMVPSCFVLLEKMPLTPGGKIDRGALPLPGQNAGDAYAAPRNKTEEQLVRIWSGVLGIEASKISIDGDFFQLGGHSLKAAVLISRIHKELNVNIPLVEIFRIPTIRKLSGYIKKTGQDPHAPIEPVEKKEYYPLSSAQKRLYILQHMGTENLSYNVPTALKLEGEFEKERLKETFKKLITRQESFRTSFHMIEDEPVQRVHDEVEFEIEYFNLSDGGVGRPQAENAYSPQTIPTAYSSFVRYFDLSQAPLLRVRLVKIEAIGHIFMVDMHHIVTDGTSMPILVKEFTALYEGQALPPLSIQYKDFTGWQNSEKQSGVLEKQEAYWLEEFTGQVPRLNLPTDYVRPPVQRFEGDVTSFELDREAAVELKKMALDQEATLYMMLLALFNVLFSRVCGQEDIVIGAPLAGRRHADLESIIGFFINMLPLRNYPLGEKTFLRFLKEVKENTLNAYENQDYQFEDLVEKTMNGRIGDRDSLVDVVFTLQNMEASPGSAPESREPGLKLQPYGEKHTPTPFDIAIIGLEAQEGLLFSIKYKTSLFKEETIEMMIKNFKEVVSAVLDNPGIQLKDIATSHDLLAAQPDALTEVQGDFDFF